jgi:hypothetical protein
VDASSLLAFVRHHAWANDRILTTAAELSDDEFRRDGVLDHGSAFQTIRHLVDVDWSWGEFCIGNDVDDPFVWDHGSALEELNALFELPWPATDTLGARPTASFWMSRAAEQVPRETRRACVWTCRGRADVLVLSLFSARMMRR